MGEVLERFEQTYWSDRVMYEDRHRMTLHLHENIVHDRQLSTFIAKSPLGHLSIESLSFWSSFSTAIEKILCQSSFCTSVPFLLMWEHLLFFKETARKRGIFFSSLTIRRSIFFWIKQSVQTDKNFVHLTSNGRFCNLFRLSWLSREKLSWFDRSLDEQLSF
jgi:hypothetical protein